MNASAPAIAIVGLACRYPDADTPQALWEMALAQRRAFRRLPACRLNLADYAEAEAGADGTCAGEAAVLAGWHFDRERFRVPAATVRATDPAHWLALTVAADALADAGCADGAGLPRASTGVVLGNTLTGESSRAGLLRLRWPYARRTVAAALAAADWPAGRRQAFLDALEARWKAPFPEPDADTLAGGLANTIAGRICNHYDFGGGGWTVDGACASSLLALAQACSALAAGELDVAIAGGVDLSLDPFELVGFARVGALARGEMRVFDAAGNGFWPGEGCGIAVLMRAADAHALGRRPYALIRGWGIASDGAGGLTRPEVAGQRRAIARAWTRAGASPAQAALFECHGTGTAVGDPVELSALAGARRADDAQAPPAAVGSIKANIGHTKAAAGAAGLIKTALALAEGLLPPTTGCRTPHPVFAAEAAGLRPLTTGEPWPAARPRLAGLSGFGFGGIDVHLVLAAADDAVAAPVVLSDAQRRLLGSAQDAELLLFAAADREALAAQLARVAGYAAQLSRAELSDLACTLSAQVDPDAPARAAVLATTPSALAAGLARVQAALAAGEQRLIDATAGAFLGLRAAGAPPPRLLLLFPGQAAPVRVAGGAWARRYEAVQRLYAAAGPLAGDPESTALAQPAIVAASLAALAVFDSLGLAADVAIGHSLGELVALHWAGALDAAAVLRLARVRGAAMAATPAGAMASLALDAAAAATAIAGSGAVLAALNGPRQTVIAGSEAAVGRALVQAGGGTRLPVAHAFHSPAMSAAVVPLAAQLAAQPLHPTQRAWVSSVSGGVCAAGTDARALLLDQLTAPVRWQSALTAALATGVDLAIEAGPGELLAGLVRAQSALPVLSVDAAGPSLAPLLAALGAAWAVGCRFDARALNAGRHARPFALDWRADFLANPCESAPAYAQDGLADPGRTDDDRTPGVPADAGLPAASAAGASVHPAAAGAVLPATADALELLRTLFAGRAELPVEALAADCRPLADLHLNSIAVAQVLVQASRALGLPPPVEPTQYANADLAAIARALDELRRTAAPVAAETGTGSPAGVDGWVRTFVEVQQAAPLPESAAGEVAAGGDWQVLALPGDPLAARITPALAGAPGRGLALCLPTGAAAEGRAALALLPAALAGLAGRERLLIVGTDADWGGWARTLWLERVVPTVCALVLPADAQAGARARAELAIARDFHEARYAPDGRRTQTVWQALAPFAAPVRPVLGPGDVLLVSGGGKGIAAECALALARAGGAKLLLLGRADPAHDAELAANLERCAAAGVESVYVPADAGDAAAVRRAVADGVARLGPVTALLHGAGRNRPAPLATLGAEDYAATLAPKTGGLANLLAALDAQRLKLLVAFGSVIARCGLAGEADYALANERLARAVEDWARAHPHCRCRVPEWSVWSGTGMGERLGRVDALARAGIAAIPPGRGVEALVALLGSAAPLPVRVVVAGRLPEGPNFRYAPAPLPLGRFLETVVLHVPGVELLAEARLHPAQDPYLADHVLDGEAVWPGVFGLEAMAQLAGALLARTQAPTFEDVHFLRPVVVPAAGETIRIAALLCAPDTVELVLRCAGTGYAVDHYRARCRYGAPADMRPAPMSLAAPTAPALAADALYGSGLLFQRGRLRRVTGYEQLEACRCRARLGVDAHEGGWFGRFLPATLALGDPGLRDATLHALQACIPHRRLVPVGLGRWLPEALDAPGPWTLDAYETAAGDGRWTWTIAVHAADGRLRERWEALELAGLGPLPVPTQAALLGPYLERRCAGHGLDLRVALAAGRQAAVRQVAGGVLHLHRRPDGKPEARRRDGRLLADFALAHAAGLTLAATASGADLEAVVARPAAVWQDLLGEPGLRLALAVAGAAGEGLDVAATRVWCARECIKKAGLASDTPLVLDTADGDAVCLAAGGRRLLTVAIAPGAVPAIAALLAPVAPAVRALAS